MAYLELILLIAAIVALIVVAQRGRLKASDYAVLSAVAAAHGLEVERGEGTAALSGVIDGRPVRVHAILGGWAITVTGVDDEGAALAAAPDAQVGAGKLQLATSLDADAMGAAIARALNAAAA